MDVCGPDTSRVAAEILAYLSGHPDAQDTIEGIAAWWLGKGRSELPAAFFKEILSDLVTQGLVEARREGDGTVLYHAHRGRRE